MRLGRKLSLASLTAIFIVSTFFLSAPEPAQAQFGGVVSVVSDVPGVIKWVWEKTTAAIDKANKIIGNNILTGAFQAGLNTIAQESATFLAQGGKGNTPLIRTKTFERVFKDARDAAYGDFIGRMSEGYFEGLGIDLCAPSVDVQARITMGIINDIAPPTTKPKCEIRQVQKNWVQFGKTLDSGRWMAASLGDLSADQRVDFFGGYLDPNNNDIGAFLKLNDLARATADKKVDESKITAAVCRGYLDNPRPISDDVAQTCDKIANMEDGFYKDYVFRATFLKSENVFVNAAKLFKNTLMSKMMKRFISGTWSLANLTDNSNTNLRDSLINMLRGRVDLRRLGSAAQLYADLNTVDVQSIDNFDYLSEMGACPADKRIASQLNCTADPGLIAAVNNKETVRVALDSGHLHANWPLVSYLNSASNGDKACFQGSYCYSNIAKLRSYRVLPLGWEIAAALSPVGRPMTLGQVVDCFENNGLCDLDESANIYYHLIDPNWVLTAPLTQCKALVSGSSLQDVNSNQRQEVCVDRPSCLSEGDDGNCATGYGYCTKERNIWRFTGTQCQEQFASCQVLVRKDNGAKYSYVTNTLKGCDASQAGCSWYSKNQINFGTAADPAYDWNPADRLYLNNQAESCPAEKDGCQEFINPQSAGANLVANSDFVDYQANPATDYSDFDWFNDNEEDTFVGWNSNGLQLFTSSKAGQVGSGGVKAVGNGSLSTSALTGPLIGETVTLSWYAKATTACQTQATLSSSSATGTTVNVDYTEGWQRYQMSYGFAVDNPDHQAIVALEVNNDCGPVYIDGVKVEIGPRATAYSGYGQTGTVYLSGQRTQCSEQEVGCQLYQPANGDPTVPGIISPDDYCPAECVGYQTFAQLPTTFELLEGAAPTATQINFIAKTAKACPASEVGCSEFTNQDEVAAGGEGKNYFSFLRQCVKASQGITYYTLEGSDTSGFQVKTWQILRSNLSGDDGPCTTIAIGGTACIDTVASQAVCTAADMATNPNCREFFDTSGLSYLRLQDKVIFASDDCHPFRRSGSNQIYSGLASESRRCGSGNVNCSEYRGNQSSNIRTIFTDTFEGRTSYAPWAGQGSGKISLSTEAVNTNGHSLAVSAVGEVVYPVNNQIVADREYYLSFWLKTTQPGSELRAYLGDVTGSQTKCGSGPCQFAATTVAVAGDWQLYKVGPLLVDQVVTPDNVRLTLVPSATGMFLDNIILRESLTNLYLIRDSWKTPASCDQPFVGANLGCQLYTTSDKQKVALRSFSQICRQEAVGCQAVINTRNSNYPYEQVFNVGDKSQVTVPADVLEYVVIDQKKACEAKYQGCQALGKPNINRNLPETDPRYVRSYQTVYLINDPDRYKDQLCKNEGLFCQEYTSSDGSSHYYRDPGNRTCTYKEGVSVKGVVITGWFQTDSLEGNAIPLGCYSDNVTPLDDYQIYRANDNHYDNWTGLCPGSQNQCSQFIDTQATNGDNFLSNPKFDDSVDAKADWGVWKPDNIINTLTEDQIFAANPSSGTATLYSQPRGLALIFQRFFNTSKDTVGAKPISNNDTYTISADVKIKNLNIGTMGKATVQVVMRCEWDSPYDKDYCGTVTQSGVGIYSVAQDYSRSCKSDADCPGNQICYKQAQGYCESATNKTQQPCDSDSRCAAGYTCNRNVGYESNDSAGNRRDHMTEFYVGADVKDLSSLQTLTANADLASASRGDELVMCEPTFRIALDCPDGGDCINDDIPNEVEFSNLSLRKAQSYYYLNNNSIDDSSCNGRVSKKDGCILFSDPNDPVKNYNSFLTYLYSERANDAAVSPVVCDSNSADPLLRACTNDANRIIKVTRDRECAEWLACKTSAQIFDPQTNAQRQVCSEVARCDRYSSMAGNLNCSHWLPDSATKIDYDLYRSRDTRYDAIDYSGYSLFNRYPVDHLRLVDVSVNAAKNGPDLANPDYRLVRAENCSAADAAACSALATNYGQLKCGSKDSAGKPSGAIYGTAGTTVCVTGIDGSRFDLSSPFVIKPTARGYAETDSPFPQSVMSSTSGQQKRIKFGFQQAGICDSSVASCEPGYYKLQYGSGQNLTRFFSINGTLGNNEVPSCICSGGNLDGKTCTVVEKVKDEDISLSDQCPGGSPAYLTRSDIFLNWGGYCLEPDYSTSINGSASEFACLSWLPVDNALGGIDYFNQNRDAGYNLKAPAYYCAESVIVEDRWHWVTAKMKLKDIGDYYAMYNKDGSTFREPMGGSIGHDRFIFLPFQDMGSDQAHDVYPVATINGKSVCLNNPDIIGYVDYPDYVEKGKKAHLGYADYCLGYYDGATDYLQCSNSNERCDGTRGTFFNAESWPRPLCTYLAAAVNERGDNAAKTNLFWSDYKQNGQPYAINFTPAIQGYTLERDDTPYGSVVPGSGFVPQQFSGLTVKNRGELPRAGSPYACNSDRSQCQSLADAKSNLYIKGWTDPGFGNKAGSPADTYDVGVNRLKQIYQKLFGIYRYAIGKSCAYLLCDGGPNGGNACSVLGSSAGCKLEGNSCQTVAAHCEKSATDGSACHTCPAGFELQPDHSCSSDPESEMKCAVDCTPYAPDFSCVDAAGGLKQCKSGPGYADSHVCQVDASAYSCDTSGDKFYSYLDLDLSGTSCCNGADCVAVGSCTRWYFLSGALAGDSCEVSILALNSSAVCQPEAKYCQGPDFTSRSVRCDIPGQLNNLGQEIPVGDATCNFPATCKYAGDIQVPVAAGSTDTRPFCIPDRDSYQPLCDPDTNPSCDPNSTDAIRQSALPLDGTMTKDFALVEAAKVLPTTSDNYKAIANASRPNSRYVEPAYGPIIAEPNCPATSLSCDLGTVGNFLVNDQKTGQIKSDENTMLATISFYALANKYRMPLRSIEVDWGDGTRQANVGYYKNNWPVCNPGTVVERIGRCSIAKARACAANADCPAGQTCSFTWGEDYSLEFAGTTQACDPTIRTYFHVYQYSAAFDGAASGLTGCPSGYACYRPKVRLQDNWGWCSNDAWGPIGQGCTNLAGTPAGYINYGVDGGATPSIIMIKKSQL
ncbi:MAG: hypothetical protein V1846_01635 [Candidatus Komeilibacteria bacterium]